MKTKKSSKKNQVKKSSKKPLRKDLSSAKKQIKKIVTKKKIEKKLEKPINNSKLIKAPKISKKSPAKIRKIKEVVVKNKNVGKKNDIKKITKKLVEKNIENNKKSSIGAKKKANEIKQNNYTINNYVVYPSHGVGKIIDIETISVMQQQVSCYLIYFDRERLTIKIPTNNVEKFGIRPLVSKEKMNEVFSILRSGVKKMKGMWSRRAQEYETKINSGDIIMLAEVLRDLTRDIEDSERSYSERIIYETAIFRLACEYSAIYGVSFETAKDKVTITAKDKLESESKSAPKDDDFDDFDKIKKSEDPEEEEDEDDEEEEEEEEDDFNYEYNEDDDFDDDDEKPRKKKK